MISRGISAPLSGVDGAPRASLPDRPRTRRSRVWGRVRGRLCAEHAREPRRLAPSAAGALDGSLALLFRAQPEQLGSRSLGECDSASTERPHRLQRACRRMSVRRGCSSQMRPSPFRGSRTSVSVKRASARARCASFRRRCRLWPNQPRSSGRAAQEARASRDAPVWIYPGDLEFGGGAEIALQGFAAWNRPDAVLLMACRRKTPQADEALARLRTQAKRWGIEPQVRWVGETRHIHELLALSDFVVMVNRTAYAKMDYPLVALESMCLARPVLVGREPRPRSSPRTAGRSPWRRMAKPWPRRSRV